MTLKSGLQTASLREGLPCGRLLLKIASTPAEIKSVQALRFRVFNEELGEGIPQNAALGLDIDEFDAHCDHLMVIDHGEVIGTYRLLHGPNRPKRGFYSETEFDMRNLKLDREHTVELGRGCIDAIHRKQTTLMALFWGLDRYMIDKKARYLIGCGSLPPLTTADDAEATFAKLNSDAHVFLDKGVRPLPENTFLGDAERGSSNLPPLVSLYVSFGAQVLGRPAFDPLFRCYDLFMYFDLEEISEWGQDLLDRFNRRLDAAKQSEQAAGAQVGQSHV